MKRLLAALALLAPMLGHANEPVTYLLPAAEALPAFIPFQLARHRGYYADAGLDVTFEVSKGGVDAAKQVGAGNADMGGGTGESPIIVRANGLPIRGIALLGGGGLAQVIARKDAGIHGIADLAGKRVGVIAFQNTNFYALLGALAATGVKRDSVDIQAVGQGGITRLVAAKSLDAIANVPENAAQIEALGTAVESFPIDSVFPSMAQAILSSDATIEKRPVALRAFVQATLRALRDCIADPDTSAKDYVAAMPVHQGEEAFFRDVIVTYARLVYRTEPGIPLGAFDPAGMDSVRSFFLQHDIIARDVKVQDLYTNRFVE